MSVKQVERFGTIHGLSRQLGIPTGVLEDRCRGLTASHCMLRDPKYPEHESVTDVYAEPDVLRVCADLLPPI